MDLIEPTAEQCESNAIISDSEEGIVFAAWYPQMGGYCGKCLVQTVRDYDESGCFDVFVWHDGEFPFSDSPTDCSRPIRVHHCDADQFIEFGKLVKKMQGKADE